MNNWVSPVDRARIGNQDPLSRLDALETSAARASAITVALQSLSEGSSDFGVVTTGGIFFGSGDPNDLTTSPTGLFIDSIGVHIFSSGIEVGRFGNLIGFLIYAAATVGIGIGGTNGYLTYDTINGLGVKGAFVVAGLYPDSFDVWNEIPLGPVDGNNAWFTPLSTIVGSTVHVIVNGIWLQGGLGGGDYTIENGAFLHLNKLGLVSDVLSADYVDYTTSNPIYNDVPTDTGDHQTYQLLRPFYLGSLFLSLNGDILVKGQDYAGGDGSVFFTAGSPGFQVEMRPQPGDTVTVAYRVTADSLFHPQQVPTGTINGINKIFTLAHNYAAGTPIVVLNGVKQTITNDYTESAVNQITFVNAPMTGDTLWITYHE